MRLWGYACGVIMLGGIVYAFFGGWYWAPAGIALGFALDAANARSAQQFIVATAIRDPKFLTEMRLAGVVVD